MPTPVIERAIVFEDGAATCMARIRGADGALITIVSISTITCKVFNLRVGGAATATPTVTVATAVFDALQTDPRWTKDATGYNYRHVIAASILSGPNQVYRIEYLFTPASGEPFFVLYEITTIPVFTS
jgi:hypothetical protein